MPRLQIASDHTECDAVDRCQRHADHKYGSEMSNEKKNETEVQREHIGLHKRYGQEYIVLAVDDEPKEMTFIAA